MKTWLARCLAFTGGCGGLGLGTGLLSVLLSAGGDDGGGLALRVTAILLGVVAIAGVIALVLLLSAIQLGTHSSNAVPSPVDHPADASNR